MIHQLLRCGAGNYVAIFAGECEGGWSLFQAHFRENPHGCKGKYGPHIDPLTDPNCRSTFDRQGPQQVGVAGNNMKKDIVGGKII